MSKRNGINKKKWIGTFEFAEQASTCCPSRQVPRLVLLCGLIFQGRFEGGTVSCQRRGKLPKLSQQTHRIQTNKRNPRKNWEAAQARLIIEVCEFYDLLSFS